MREPVSGLRDVGEYKAYRRGAVHYVGHKNRERLRRVQLSKTACEQIVAMSPSDFTAAIEKNLQFYKHRGAKEYFEVRHARR